MSLRSKQKFANQLRKHPTRAEARLWSLLRFKRRTPFIRQKVIRGYIVDFYCPAIGLIIELDGSVHDLPEQKIYDQKRQLHLENAGFKVLRFRNEEVLGLGISRVMKVINKVINTGV